MDAQKDIKAFEKEAEHGKDAQIKQFAAETVPVLKDHLSMAQLASDAAKREKTSAAAGAKTAADSSGNPNQSAAGTKQKTQ